MCRKFFLDRYHFSRVKYGKLSEKLFADDPLGKYRLKWKKVFNDFCSYMKEKTCNYIMCPYISQSFVLGKIPDIQRDCFRKYVSSEFNIGFKVRRSDQCNDCAIFDILIKQEKNPVLKKELINLRKEHLMDSELCQDAIHWAFRKSYKQLGTPFEDWMYLKKNLFNSMVV